MKVRLTTGDRAFNLLPPAGEPGLTTRVLADRLGVSAVAVACSLRRLYWRGRVDRALVRGAYVYTQRPDMPQVLYRFKIELRAATFPVEEWTEMVDAENGRRLRYVERADAETAIAKMRARQPHAVMRIAPC